MNWNWFTQKPPPRQGDEERADRLTSVIAYLNRKYGNFEYAKDARALDTDGVFERTFESFVEKACRRLAVRRVLVTGANNGSEVELLNGFDVSAVDLSDVALAHLIEFHPAVHAVQADIESLPFADKAFDLYVSMRSIHASNVDVQVALRESLRVTRGPLILSISNGYNISGRLRKGMYNYDVCRIDSDMPYQYLRDVVEFLRSKGYSIETFETPSEILVYAEP